MKKFILYILSLLSAIVVLAYLLDFGYTFAYLNGIPRNKISYLLSLEKETLHHVFLGSSRVDNTIDSQVIEEVTGKKAINLGIQGAEINDSYLMLRLLNSKKIKPEVVFIQVDYSFNTDGTSAFLNSALMPYIHEDQVSELIEERKTDFKLLKYLPFYRYMIYDYKLGFREVFNSVINNEPSTDLENGYFPKYGRSGENLKASLPEEIALENKSIIAINNFAEKHNIRIVYFMAPVCSGTENMDYVHKLKEKLPLFLDYSSIFLDQDENFYNCTHLNDKGAKEFSRRIAEEIKDLY